MANTQAHFHFFHHRDQDLKAEWLTSVFAWNQNSSLLCIIKLAPPNSKNFPSTECMSSDIAHEFKHNPRQDANSWEACNIKACSGVGGAAW